MVERKKEKDTSLNIEADDITEAFEINIGKFEWPVISGFISNKFGDNNHPILRNIKIKNRTFCL